MGDDRPVLGTDTGATRPARSRRRSTTWLWCPAHVHAALDARVGDLTRPAGSPTRPRPGRGQRCPSTPAGYPHLGSQPSGGPQRWRTRQDAVATAVRVLPRPEESRPRRARPRPDRACIDRARRHADCDQHVGRAGARYAGLSGHHVLRPVAQRRRGHSPCGTSAQTGIRAAARTRRSARMRSTPDPVGRLPLVHDPWFRDHSRPRSKIIWLACSLAVLYGQPVRIERHWWNGNRSSRGRRDVYIRTDGQRWEVEAQTGGAVAGRSKVHPCPSRSSAEILADAWLDGRPEWRELVP
jgi:hypothetical protein